MVAYIKKNKVELLILCILTITFNIYVYLQSKGCELAFFDTDDYMRLVRIQEFFQHYDLNNDIIMRANAPYGCSLHWTRFYDFFLIIPAYILSFFTHSINQAIEYVGFAIAPIIKLVTIIIVFKIFFKLLKKRNAFLATAMVAANPIIAQFGCFGRPDHHAFIMLFMLIFLNNIATLIKSNFSKGIIGTAIASALCVWISPETLIPILLTNAVFGVYALIYDDKKIFERLFEINLISGIFIGIILLSSHNFTFIWRFCVGIFAIFGAYYSKDTSYYKLIALWYSLVVPSKSALPIYYDEISIVHFSLFMYMTFVFSMFAYPKIKKSLIFVCVAFIGMLFLVNYGKLFLGMGADVSDEVKQIWLSNVAEMQSPFKGDMKYTYAFFSCTVLCFLIWKLFASNLRKNILWIIFLTLISVYTIFGGIANRMMPYAVLFNTPLIVDFGMNWRALQFNRYIRIIFTFFIGMMFIFVFGIFCDDEKKAEKLKEHSIKEICAELDKLSDVPQVIMAKIDDGPAILYYTKHSVVGAPYHRQQEGILSSYKVMTAQYSESEVIKILKETNSSYIFVRKNDFLKSENKKSLAKMIVDGEYPNYLTPVSLAKKMNDIVIMKIDKSKL